MLLSHLFVTSAFLLLCCFSDSLVQLSAVACILLLSCYMLAAVTQRSPSLKSGISLHLEFWMWEETLSKGVQLQRRLREARPVLKRQGKSEQHTCFGAAL